MDELGIRHNKGKLRWSLVPFKALEPMIDVLMMGAEKYGDWNWTKGLKWTEVSESLIRHLVSFLSGEDNDSESKLSHVGHILANAMFLSYMFLFRKDLDDRNTSKYCKCSGLPSTDAKGVCFKCHKQVELYQEDVLTEFNAKKQRL